MNKKKSGIFALAALSLLFAANAAAATLARQCGVFGIVTYDPVPVTPDPEPDTPMSVLARQYGAFGIVTYDPVPVTPDPEPDTPTSVLARQYGAFGIVTYDRLPDPSAPEARTRTTDVSVPYGWLKEHCPGTAHEYYAYESSATATAANGRKVWECYLLGLDPQEATDDFKIMSFPMKADGTPDFDNLVFNPPQSDWNVSGATPKLKGASKLEGPWSEVPDGGDSTMKFFKIVVELP